MTSPSATPFQLPIPERFRWLGHAIESLLGLSTLDHYYRQRKPELNCQDFLHYTLQRLGINYTIASGDVLSIPKQGPTIIVANHPFGAIEGVMLAQMLLQHRSDLKVLANQFLHRIKELSDLFIGVDVFATQNATRTNTQGLKQAIEHLKNNGCLLIFPAGEVSTFQFKHRQITDKTWNRLIGMLVRKTGAVTVPIFIEGKNSVYFHLAGFIHPRLRTLLLVRQMLNKRKHPISLHIGESISNKECQSLVSDEAITHYLRLNTYLLSSKAQLTNSQSQRLANPSPISGAQDPQQLQEDINRLDNSCLLIEKNELQVFIASAQALPHVLNEIGRLREISFRQVNEGTGLDKDLDEYDRDYLHLFIWNSSRREIAGAYRLGLVDKLLELPHRRGVSALYSHSLFNYRRDFIESLGDNNQGDNNQENNNPGDNKLGNSIEMGRSFITKEYQRSLSALLLLWKGIATFASRNPQYTTLFGPVSISNGYTDISRSLMANFLQLHHYDHKLATLVRARNPLKNQAKRFWSSAMLTQISDNQCLSNLIYRMEGDKGLPILLKQYLGLNGKLVSFNVDQQFNNALDGMIIVNLLQVPEKLLARYMGKEQAQLYLNR